MEFNPTINNLQLNTALNQNLIREAEAARDFEAVFVQMFLKEIRPKIEDGLFNSSSAEEMFQQIHDEAY
jgi:Rod binding domain-containing protein